MSNEKVLLRRRICLDSRKKIEEKLGKTWKNLNLSDERGS